MVVKYNLYYRCDGHMKKTYYSLIILLVSYTQISVSDPVICFFFKREADRLSHDLKKLGHIATHTVHGMMNLAPIAGLYCTYAGYLTISDQGGQVQFPRKQRENKINILITPEIEPIALFENTIHHWQLMPHMPAQMYTLKENYNAVTKEYEWTSHLVDLPHDGIVPLTTIIIIENPQYLFIPSEKVKTSKTANLMLPPVYVKKGIDIMSNDIGLLIFRHLFRPVEKKAQQAPLKLTTHVLP